MRKSASERALLFVSLMGDPCIASISSFAISPQASNPAWLGSWPALVVDCVVARLSHPARANGREQSIETTFFVCINLLPPRMYLLKQASAHDLFILVHARNRRSIILSTRRRGQNYDGGKDEHERRRE